MAQRQRCRSPYLARNRPAAPTRALTGCGDPIGRAHPLSAKEPTAAMREKQPRFRRHRPRRWRPQSGTDAVTTPAGSDACANTNAGPTRDLPTNPLLAKARAQDLALKGYERAAARRPRRSGSRDGCPSRLPQNRTYAVRIRLLGTAGYEPRCRPVFDLEVIPIAPVVADRGQRCAGAPGGAGRPQTQARA